MRGVLVVFGLLSAVLFLVDVLYYSLARLIAKIGKKDRNVLLSPQADRWHCLIGIVSLMFALIHMSHKPMFAGFSPGYLSLVLLIVIGVSGYLHKRAGKTVKSSYWKSAHSMLVFGFIISFIFHIIDKMHK